jgi:hypothetical protein
MTGRESLMEARQDRTIALTFGPWGGVWFTGKRGLCGRLCLGFVAITYFHGEFTQVLDAWLKSEGQ